MKHLASIALLFALTAPTLAQDSDVPAEAKLVLVAPSSARVGELVRLDVSESAADSFKWLLVPDSTDWEVYADGAKAVFSARTPGEYRFIIACAKNGTVDVLTHVITVRGPPAQPDTPSLAEWIPYWAWAHNLPGTDAGLIAANFDVIREQMVEEKEPLEWQKRTAELNKRILGDRLRVWIPVFDKLGAAMQKRAQEGELMTLEQHRAAWAEIAEGFRNCQ